MKTLLLVCLSGLVVLALTPGIGFAEPTAPNEVGLYLTGDGYGATGSSATWELIEVFLVLTRPQGEEPSSGPFTHVAGFELEMHFSPTPADDLFLMNVMLPPGALNVDYRQSINDGLVGFEVGWPTGKPVLDEAVILATCHFFNMSDEQFFVFLRPRLGGWTIPDKMAYLGEESPNPDYWPPTPMYPVSGSFDDPVFIFNGLAVQTENRTFGSLKALYR